VRGGSAITVVKTHVSTEMSYEEVAAAAVTVEMRRRLATSHGIYGEHHSSALSLSSPPHAAFLPLLLPPAPMPPSERRSEVRRSYGHDEHALSVHCYV